MTTKSDSLQALQEYGRAATVDECVLAYLRTKPWGVPRHFICEATELMTSTVCGALDRLMKRELVVEDGAVKNNATNRTVKMYRAYTKEAVCQS